jgi:ATP-binding cassette subfamily C (CFTR/MRP) protein 1
VGIVGRTGAGKSTVSLTLFHLIQRDAGKVIIDGVDAFTIGLEDLRY